MIDEGNGGRIFLREVRAVLLELGLQNTESAIDASIPQLKQLAGTPLD